MKTMENWTRMNVSDHCGFHHRQFILMRLFQPAYEFSLEIEECLHRFQIEFAYLESLLLVYPGHETLWYHKRLEENIECSFKIFISLLDVAS